MSDEALFAIRKMGLGDREAVRDIWDARFGGRRSTQENWIDAALDPTHSAAGFVAVQRPEDEVLGFSFLEVGSPDYTRQYLGLDVLDLDPPLADRNGLFHLSCVRVEWAGQGIGSAFYERRLEVLAGRDVPRVFGIAWHRPHTVDSRVLFDKWDFTCFATVDRYYSRTDERPYCPECNGACMCTASLYYRENLSL